jgi:hypothetical protein
MSQQKPFAKQAATFSLWAPLTAFAANIVARAAGMPRATLMVVGIVSMALYVSGLALGIVALVGIRKHGREGIVGRAGLGVVINTAVLLLALMILPALVRARGMARQIKAKEAAMANAEPYRFSPPPGFVAYPPAKQMVPDAKEAYIKGDPSDAELDIVLIVEDLGGRIENTPPPASVRKRPGVQVLRERWKDHVIWVFEIRETFAEAETLTYNAQVPVLPAAIQLKVVGSAERKEKLLDVLRAALTQVEGASNW